MDYFKKLCDLATERPDWSLLIGSESKLADAVKIGADGGVTGGANVAPRLLVNVYDSATSGDDEQVNGGGKQEHPPQIQYDYPILAGHRPGSVGLVPVAPKGCAFLHWKPQRTRKRTRRGCLHHHLPSAGSLHLSAAAQRSGSANRPRAPM